MITPHHAILALATLMILSSGWFATALKAQAIIGTAAGLNGGSSYGMSSVAFSSNGALGSTLSGVTSILSSSGPLFRSGSVEVRPHVSYQWTEGSGILVAPGAEDKVTTRTFTPGVLINIGANSYLDYTFSRISYSANGLSDTSDHNLRASTGLTHSEWKFGLSGSYGTNSYILKETGRQTRDQTYSTVANVSHEIGRGTEFETSLTYSIRSASAITASAGWKGTDWNTWSTTSRLRKYISKQLNFSGGIEAGYEQIERNPDMRSWGPTAGLHWGPTQRLSMTMEVGFKRHSTLATPTYTQNFWTYDVSGTYRASATTTLSISGHSSIFASYFGQANQGDTWSAAVQQRLLARFFLSVGYSHSYSNLHFTTSNTIARFPDRIDRGNSVHTSLSTSLLGRASISVFYQRGQNRSSDSLFGYSNNQVGASASYSF